jgi:lipoprotein-releasing system permease protein
MLKDNDQGRISRPVVRIATIGIAVGIALMILSIAVVKGFQNEIRNLVIGFGSHFQITSMQTANPKDSQKLLFSDSLVTELKKIKGVRHVQAFALKPGILESKGGLQGVAIKGLDRDFDSTFLKSSIVKGHFLHHPKDSTADDLLISAYIANRLQLDTGSKVSLYFLNGQNDARQKNFHITGIYSTGLDDFDSQYVFLDIRHIRKLSGWGLNAQILVDTVCHFNQIALGATGFGGDGDYQFRWSIESWKGEGPFFLEPNGDTTIQVVVSDGSETLTDTAQITIHYQDPSSAPCGSYTIIRKDLDGNVPYIGGYEVLIDRYDRLLEMDDEIYKILPYALQAQKITERSPEIFSWLEMLDINVLIIIVLMVVISIVNMTSALLIIILERQQMIGTLKALGTTNGQIISIFFLNAISIVGRGVLWGNVIGLAIAFLQSTFQIIPLDQEHFYIDHVPVLISWGDIVFLNILTMIICAMALIFPAMYSLRISPVRSMRFS